MSLKDSWQQQRQQRQQDLAQRQHIVSQALGAITQERHSMATQLRSDLSLFREMLANQDQTRRANLQQFCTRLRHETRAFLTAAGDRRKMQAQQIAQQLNEFIQTLRQETQEFLNLAAADRLTMAQELEQELTTFTAELRTDVESYLLELATTRKNRADYVHQTLTQSRADRTAEVQAIFQQLAAFRSELLQHSAKIYSDVWSTTTQTPTTAKVAETNGKSTHSVTVAPSVSPGTVGAVFNGKSLAVIPATPVKAAEKEVVAYEKEVYNHIHKTQGARLTELEAALGINRFQTVDALRSLIKKGLITQRDRVYLVQENLTATRG